MLKRITGRTSNILTIEEAQNHLRVDSDSDISYVEGLIYAAENYLNEISSRSYVAETFDYYLADFNGWIYLPLAPIAEITHVKYYDGADVEQTMVLGTDFYQDIISEPGYIRPLENWPTVYDKPNAVVIRIVTGAESPEIIPQEYKQAALLMIGEMYEQREDKVKRFPTAVQRLITNLRLY